jgi:cytoskeleton protein RodZ
VNERESLGSHLKRERESRNISLKEVAKKIRVREQLLKALEEDRYDLLPPHPYLKGFLFNYAKVVGLDPHEVIHRYESAIQVKPTSPQEVPSQKKPQKEAERKPPEKPEKEPEKKPEKESEKKPKKESEKKPKKEPEKKPERKVIGSPRQFWIIGGVVVLSVILSLLLFSPSPKPPVEPVSPTPEVSIKPEAKKTLPPSAPPQGSVTTRVPVAPPLETSPAPERTSVPEVAAVSETKPLSLKLKGVEETWVRIQVDDQPAREMTFKPGDVTSHQAMTRIHLMVGNAGGLDVTLNGRLIEKFGKSGEVVTSTITLQGVETKPYEKTKPTNEE